MTTFVVPAAELQPPTVTVTEYVPASAIAAFGRVGFCCDEVKPFGPLHANVALGSGEVAKSEIVEPRQYGPPFEAVGAQAEVSAAALTAIKTRQTTVRSDR